MGPTATRTPGQTLREEHRLILRALELVKMGADRLDEGRPLPDGWWEQLVEWLRTFADRSHHGKEEQHLFPALIQAGVPADGGPIGVMLDEHAEGRVLIRIMAEDHGARRVAAAHAYVHLLSAHIEKENKVLFPLADAILDEQAQAVLAREFEKVEAEGERPASVEHAEDALARLAVTLRS